VKDSLSALLEARSIAVIGASPRPGSVGNEMVRQLLVAGAKRAFYPVNPSYSEVEGLRCYPAIEDLPEPVDLVLFGIANERLEEQFVRAAEAGARSAVIFGSAYEESGPSGRQALTDRLRSVANSHGMVVCGGNCMGFVNLEAGLRALVFAEREDLEIGPIAFFSHSGSVFTALLHNLRGLRFNLAVSTGQELTTTVADYMDFALAMQSTGVIALFLETVRDPKGFLAALNLAADKDVPVVALKVGVEERANELVTAHSGALAGSDAAYEALFEATGVMRVETLSEMADLLELLSSGRRASSGALATVHDSGGERAHTIDVAARIGVSFARLGEKTIARLESLLDPGLPAVNPLDAWGTGRDYERVFRDCMLAMIGDDDTAALAFAVDLAGEELEAGYSRAAVEVFKATDVPVAVVSNLPSAISPEIGAGLRAAGVPVLEGTATGLSAFKHLFAHRDFRALPARDVIAPSPAASLWRRRVAASLAPDEVDGLELLESQGIPVVSCRRAGDEDELIDAAREVGYPIVLKSRGPAHKAVVGGVFLGIRGEAELRDAYRSLAGRLGPEVVVAEMAPSGVELALGVVADAQFGPLVMVAAGGTLIEKLGDRAFALPPLDRARARRLLDRIALRAVLDGSGGSERCDVDSVVDAIVSVSVLARDLDGVIEALDVNPLVCGPWGCVAVDALVVRANR
jgi:acyl-CoA synthetase (NDP forming)